MFTYIWFLPKINKLNVAPPVVLVQARFQMWQDFCDNVFFNYYIEALRLGWLRVGPYIDHYYSLGEVINIDPVK